MEDEMKELADNAKPEIVYYDVQTNDNLSLYLDDSTFVCYDLKDNTLKRISSKIYEKRDGKNICSHVIYQITFNQIFK